jgi:dynamin 1-like protein
VDFSKVREKINELTDKSAGKNKGIIDDPIVLTVYSTTCPDLTIIDLPGITRIPLQNSDQPKDIEKITKNMALKYNSLISNLNYNLKLLKKLCQR